MSNVTAKSISSSLSSTEKEAIRDNIGLGTSATVDTGTGSTEVPLNSDLGEAATLDKASSAQINTGTSTTTVVTPSALAGSEYNPDNTHFKSSGQTITNGGTTSLSNADWALYITANKREL